MVLKCSENGESIQILHYQNGEKYEPHFDYFHDKNNQALGGHRIATVLMYLSNVGKGGETIFPNAEVVTCPSLIMFALRTPVGITQTFHRGSYYNPRTTRGLTVQEMDMQVRRLFLVELELHCRSTCYSILAATRV